MVSLPLAAANVQIRRMRLIDTLLESTMLPAPTAAQRATVDRGHARIGCRRRQRLGARLRVSPPLPLMTPRSRRWRCS